MYPNVKPLNTARRRAWALWSSTMAAACVVGCAAQALAMPDPGVIPAVKSSADDPGPLAHVQEFYVPTPEMPDVKVRIWRATNGSKKSVVLLDGGRASNDISGWEHETNAHLLANHGLNVIEPVGGPMSFYSDWLQPSKGAKQPYRYKWATFLSATLPAWEASIGLDPNGNAIAGLSMGGSAALIQAAYHPDKYKFAATYSGWNMIQDSHDMICISMWSQDGFDCDSMWGPASNELWKTNDPYAQAEKLRDVSLYISWGNGKRAPYEDEYDKSRNYNAINDISAQVLEGTFKGNNEKFKQHLDDLGIPATYNIQEYGTHMWSPWEENLWLSLDQMKAAIGADAP